MGSLVADAVFTHAVSNTFRRAEKAEDARVIQTHVDYGVFDQLDNDRNQILYGRRGTGKTHAVKVLAGIGNVAREAVVAYVDLRTTGSAAEVEDRTQPALGRCIRVYRDIMASVHMALLEAATDPEIHSTEKAIPLVEDLGYAISRVHRRRRS